MYSIINPAGLFFDTDNLSERLDATDAEFVDVFHTDLIQGTSNFRGHVDFFFNCGFNQPGCWEESSTLNCNHVRAAW